MHETVGVGASVGEYADARAAVRRKREKEKKQIDDNVSAACWDSIKRSVARRVPGKS